MTSSFWLQWRKQFENYGVEPNLTDYHKVMMSQISGVSQKQCNFVAKGLNEALSLLSTENNEWYNQLKEAVVSAGDISEDSLKVSDSFKVTTSDLSVAWGRYNQLKKQFENIPQELQSTQAINDLESAKHLALSLQGKINNFKGQILETFLTGLSETFANITSNVAQNNIDEVINQFAQGIKTANFKVVTNTEGSQRNESIKLSIDDETFIMQGAQQKVDVTLPSPFQSESSWRISAKNYSSLRDIHLLSGGSFLRLVYSGIQPQNNDVFKFLLNALTIPSSNWTNANLDQLKKIFMIQAIAGGQLNNMANVLVITINANKNPFRIISIAALLNSIFETNNLEAILFTPELESSLPLGSIKSRTNADIEAIKNFKVGATLSKSVLTLSYLSQLT